jgi:hypothetical protein
MRNKAMAMAMELTDFINDANPSCLKQGWTMYYVLLKRCRKICE